MIADDRPMLPMRENGIALYRAYQSLGAGPQARLAPWQVALLDWWQFIGHREALRLLRDVAGGRSISRKAD